MTDPDTQMIRTAVHKSLDAVGALYRPDLVAHVVDVTSYDRQAVDDVVNRMERHGELFLVSADPDSPPVVKRP